MKEQTAEPEPKQWRLGTLTYTRAGLVVLFCWLLWGDFGHYLKERSIPQTVQYLLGRFDVPDVLVGFLLGSLPWLLAIFIVPVVGYRSDRHRSRWGRRIPFLILPTLVTFVAMLVMAFGLELGKSLHAMLGAASPGEKSLRIWVIAAGWTIFECCTIICSSVFQSLVIDVVPREVIGRFFAMFRVVSLMAGVLFNYYIFGYVDEHYALIFIGIGAIYLLSFLTMCYKVKEGFYPPPPVEESTGSGLGNLCSCVRTYCRDCFSLPYYRWIFFAIGMGYATATPIILFGLLYAQALGMSMKDFGFFGAIQLIVSMVQAYPVGWLVDRFHPMRVMLVALVSLVVANAAAFYLVNDAAGYGWAIVICGTLAGFYGNATVALPAVLFPKEKFATYDSARQVIIAVAGIILAPLCGLSLDLLGHDYRFMYLWACGLSVCALGVSLIAYRRFLGYGGPKNYVAPVS